MEKTKHINILELKAIHLALLTFSNEAKNATIHLHLDNVSDLTYLLVLYLQNLELIKISLKIWTYLLRRNITITWEYLPSELSHIAYRKTKADQG